MPNFKPRLKRRVSWPIVIILLGITSVVMTNQGCGKGFVSSSAHLSSLQNGPATFTLTDNSVAAKTCGSTYSPGSAMIHRLTNDEYNNTVRDLLYTSTKPATNFQSSSIGSTGFSNESMALTVSNQMFSDYADAADKLATEVINSKSVAQGAYSKIASCALVGTPTTDCAKKTIQTLAQRAFRRSVSTADVDALMKIYTAGGSFDVGLHDVIMSMLIDPRFIFNYFDNSNASVSGAVYALNNYELINRLSYFIWQSMPDESLFAAAADGSIVRSDVLKAQIKRMLKDSKSSSLANVLRREWTKLSTIDSISVTGIDADTMNAIRQETQLLFTDVIQNDLSLMTLINGDFTYVNNKLAQYYGWNIPQATTTSFVKVQIPVPERRGVLGHAGTLIVHGGNSTVTHPVQRGRLVADSFFCEPPPPPPPGVPTIPGTASGLTMREQLLQHTSSAACIGCHKIMDTVGLGLENFDTQGKWRTTYPEANNAIIDASGRFENGSSFTGPQSLIDSIANQDKVKTCLVKKLMSLAVARAMTGTADLCVAEMVGGQTVNTNIPLSDVIYEMTQTLQFRMNTGAQ